MKVYQLIAMTVFVLSNFAFAQNWVQQPTSYSDEKAIYIDVDNIQKDKFGRVTYNLKRVYHNPQDFDDKRQYHSQMVTIKADCETKKIKPMQVIFYNKDNVIIAKHKTTKATWWDARQDPVIVERLKFICDDK